MLLSTGLLVGVLVLVVAIRAWRRYRMRPASVFRRIAHQRLDDVIIDDGLDGEIHLEHVLLTARGIVVVDLRNVNGALFGSERMDQWTVLDGKRRFTFANPLEPLFARINAVRNLAGNVPVSGRVVLSGPVELAGGAIDRVCELGALEEEFRQANAADGGRSQDAFQSAWSRLVKAARPISS
jgi:hypothetical protein